MPITSTTALVVEGPANVDMWLLSPEDMDCPLLIYAPTQPTISLPNTVAQENPGTLSYRLGFDSWQWFFNGGQKTKIYFVEGAVTNKAEHGSGLMSG